MKSGGMSKNSFEEDATASFMRLLPMQCRFADGTTLRDLFLLLQPKGPQLEEILGHHCQEFIEEGLSRPKDSSPKETVLELHWIADNSMGVLEGLEHPQFDEILAENTETPVSTRVLGCLPTYQFVDTPLRLKHAAQIWMWEKLECSEIKVNMGFTLFQILYGIFWELSFWAHPSVRDEKLKEIDERLDTPDLE
jgi:hypothetical protein